MQQVLDASLASASRLTQSLFAGPRWTAGQASDFINSVRQITVATVSARGEPHAATAICACLDGVIHFTASHGSALLGNLRRDPKVAFTITDQSHGIIGRGVTVLAGKSLEAHDLVDRLAAATRKGTFTPAGWDGYIYAVTLDRLFAS